MTWVGSGEKEGESFHVCFSAAQCWRGTVAEQGSSQAQAALPTMMSGLDGCLRADMTWVGSGDKEGESFHVCFSAAQCWLGTVAEQGSAWSASTSISL